uniref:Transmembrane protein 233 n=1 Tax=Prolemur simus TaxID=1328070 RepID=A0A8C8YI29_PROSS
MAAATSPKGRDAQVSQVQQARWPVVLMPSHPPEKDYLFLAIISFFFFILLAIPALFFSLKTREANFLGNQRKAQKNSRLALGFSISSILVGSMVIICSIVLRVLKQKI